MEIAKLFIANHNKLYSELAMIKNRVKIEKDQKPSIEMYTIWLKENHDIQITGSTGRHYESVARDVKEQLECSIFWVNIATKLKEFEEEYQLTTDGYELFMDLDAPKIKTKPWSSFIEKTFRKNILNNSNWPNAPNEGWVLPENWLSNINDIVRTKFVVKYLDGVEFLMNKLALNGESCGLVCEKSWEARDEGYYALHMNIRQNYLVKEMNWTEETKIISFEIQITTQLQDVIRRLLHEDYEEKRTERVADEKWQWNYKSEEFSTNYLGHILHYVEGMIMDVREKGRGGFK
ncbi:hypothetical protein [Methanothrix sp.]|uniref:hypothetical protein n=2 Tax=Methanothrix sp. TaxID=90426 RepID=UPI003BB68ECB